jgi:hypothetical protein
MAAWIVDLGGPPNTNVSMYVNEYDMLMFPIFLLLD